MRILYLGLPLGVEVLRRAGHAPAVVGLGHLDAPGRRRAFVRARGALILGKPDLEAPDVRAAIDSARCDVLLSWFWPRRVPGSLLASMPRGAFGVHPSLLPRWRGPDPYYHAIRAGDAETGVTLHRLDPEYDTGEIIEQTRLAIAPDENAWQLARRLDRPSLALLVRAADRLAKGEALAGRPQDPALITEAPRPDDDALALSFHTDVASILRAVRAGAPAPGATALIEDLLVVVSRASRWTGSIPAALEPSEAFATPHGLAVRAADGAVLLEDIEDEDGARLVGAETNALIADRP